MAERPRNRNAIFAASKSSSFVAPALIAARAWTSAAGDVCVRCGNSQWDEGARVAEIEGGDTGIGMDEGWIERVVMPFTRGESVRSRKNDGTGLGLAISKKLAELMHGDIELESAPGGGSVFSVRLPMGDLQPSVLAINTAG